MRVAFLGIKGLPARGGAERVVEAVATRLPGMGISPVVYCDRNYTPAETSIDGLKLIRLAALPGKYVRAISFNLVAAFHAIFLANYDLIHLHHIEASFVLPMLRMRYKVVATSHGFAYQIDKWSPSAKRLMKLMENPFVKLANIPTAVSAGHAQSLSTRYGRTVRFVPNGAGMEYKPDLLKSAKMLKGHGLVPGEFLILVTGRIIPTKGVHLAIRAHKQMKRKIALLIVGDETQAPAYARELRDMAGPLVRFQAHINDQGIMLGLMAQARILIFPSLTEAMSMVLLEAASLGVPIICSNIPENRKILGDEATYFELENKDSLVEILDWAMDNPARIVELGKQAKENIHQTYAWDTIASQYAELYRELA